MAAVGVGLVCWAIPSCRDALGDIAKGISDWAAPAAKGAGCPTAPLLQSRGGPPRAENGDYLPDPKAEGPHTTIGTRTSSKTGDPYRQGATFDGEGEFKGRTDVSDHGRSDHADPHWHPATGPGGVESGSHPLPEPEDVGL
jgi:hypothetical protein